jgi:putative endonuclease
MFFFRKQRRAPTHGELGRLGERLAGLHLKRDGYRVIARNVRSSLGELDLVALAPDRNTVVFVEVKTRAIKLEVPSPPPESAVNAKKRRKLLALSQQYAHRQGWDRRPLRIDVIAIDWPAVGKPSLRHYANAVQS